MRLATIFAAVAIFATAAFYYTNEPAENSRDFLVPVTYIDAGVTVLMPKSWGNRYSDIVPAGPGARLAPGAGQLNWAATTTGDSVLFICLY